MDDHQAPIRSLVLLGGMSSRMGSPKYLLPIPSEFSKTGDDAPLLLHNLYMHHLFQVKYGDPLLRTVTLSVRDDVQREEIKDLIARHELDLPIDLDLGYVQDAHTDEGPAAGLLAAHRLDADAHWLITGCDYPAILDAALVELKTEHHRRRRAITCFMDANGRTEPLLALWSNTALERLSRFVDEQHDINPEPVLRALEREDMDGIEPLQIEYSTGVTKVKPVDANWLISVNTKEQWNKLEKQLRTNFSQSDP